MPISHNLILIFKNVALEIETKLLDEIIQWKTSQKATKTEGSFRHYTSAAAAAVRRDVWRIFDDEVLIRNWHVKSTKKASLMALNLLLLGHWFEIGTARGAMAMTMIFGWHSLLQ